jgi:exonuclease III
LDHILVSRQLALACRSVTIDNAVLADEAFTTGYPEQAGSFHAPVAASFEFP